MDEITKDALFGNAKSLSPEAREKRKTINIKIFKFGCLPIIGVLIIIMILSLFSNNLEESSNVQDEVKSDNTQSQNKYDIVLSDSTTKEIIEMYKSELKTISKSITSKYDDFEGITWYSHKNQPKYSNTNACYLYVGAKNDQYWGRFVVRFSGEDWIFVKRIIVKCDDMKITLNTSDVKRDNSSGDVWEWIDIPYDKNEQEFFCIINSKETIFRFEGNQYSRDYTLSSKEKNALIDMYNFMKYNNEITVLQSH